MDTIGKVNDQFLLAGLLINFHFIYPGRTESHARVSIFLGAAVITGVQIQYFQMGWLFFLMGGSGVINITDFIKGLDPVIFNIPFLIIGGGLRL